MKTKSLRYDRVVYTRKALADIPLLKAAKLDGKVRALIDLVRENPYKAPPPYEKLRGNLAGALSRRINVKHRFVYQVIEETNTVKIISRGRIMTFERNGVKT